MTHGSYDIVFFQYCAPLVEMRRMNYNLTFKRHLGNLSSGPGHDLAGKGHVAYQSICIVKLKSSKVFFIAQACRMSLSEVIEKTAGGLP